MPRRYQTIRGYAIALAAFVRPPIFFSVVIVEDSPDDKGKPLRHD